MVFFLSVIRLFRPKQWLKNLLLIFPPLFGGVLFSPEILRSLFFPVLAFCLASSANYACNDVLDAEKDALHPTKKHRPIPAGKVSKHTALLAGGLLFCAAFFCAIATSWTFTAILAVYVVLMGCYSLWLKHVVVLDIFVIATGFLLRLEAGAQAVHVPVSTWLFLSVFFLAMFLSIGKRVSEKSMLAGPSASLHRKTLAQYPDAYLEGVMLMTGTAAMLTYALYTIDHANLLYTVPLCCLGLFRYMFWIKIGNNGDPSEALLHDPFLAGISAVWFLTIIGTKYLIPILR
ncbi:MAG: decaprenyl-phosphate phosphoribosyltransferase [Desulfobulbus sp.]|jgi:4-hydroxybenzoate polyprenyltransferase|uniref:decaprenyl-phosphate phosphoribosyltransferase n=1 Tax=Desulfobulbus sp. TaxID=895 RepID=UPI00283BFC99|nr:decaprenyl-phosphate phosphoribosyltransferase [Desulfobulbus sp.]MDR2550384.1 decaprenyl-phosphate phosphoribosyltransferase [Desulfobulbus sp.]